MSAQFALDPALPNSPNTENKPNPSSYSILPAYPPLPGWGPFPGVMFAPPGVAPPPMPMYMAPPTWAHPNPNQPQPQAQQPAQSQATPQPQPTQAPAAKPRPKRVDPPPINPQAAASPHYQNPGGLGGVYTPPTQNPPASTSTPGSHYTHKPASHPLSDLGRPFACGLAGCSAAFDRKSDCERHRRTHVKSGNESRPFRCSREGCEAAFDRKDALMRHERNERTHLVRQTQPGNRIKKPNDTPRRMSTRKRKAVNMFLDASEDDDEDHKRPRTGLSDGGEELATNMEDMVVIPDEQLVIDPALHAEAHGLASLGPTSSGHSLGSTSHGLDAGPHGLDSTSHEAFELGVQPGEVETMQAVEAIQAALQQIEADVDAERGA